MSGSDVTFIEGKLQVLTSYWTDRERQREGRSHHNSVTIAALTFLKLAVKHGLLPHKVSVIINQTVIETHKQVGEDPEKKNVGLFELDAVGLYVCQTGPSL